MTALDRIEKIKDYHKNPVSTTTRVYVSIEEQAFLLRAFETMRKIVTLEADAHDLPIDFIDSEFERIMKPSPPPSGL